MQQEEKPRDYVGLSSCGEHELLLALKKLGIKERFTHRTYMIFLTGHLWEALIIEAMNNYGLEVTGQQNTLEFHGFKGHIDGIFEDHLLEFKTMSDKSFKSFIKTPEKNTKYVYQLGVYAHCMDTEKAGWICLNKQTMELAYVPYPFEYQEAILQRVEEKSRILSCINTLDDVRYIYVPEPKDEVFKKERTGLKLVPLIFSYSDFRDAFYETYESTNGYNKPTTYVSGIKPFEQTKQWLEDYIHDSKRQTD